MAHFRLRRAIGAPIASPGPLALCGLIGLLEVGTWLVIAPFLAGASRPAVVGWLLLQRLLLIAVLAALLPGCYAAVREGLGLGATLAAAVDRMPNAGPHVLASLLVSRAIALGLTVGILLVALTALGVVDTASVWTDAYVGLGVDRPALARVGVPVAVVGASWLAQGGVGLHDLRAIDSEDAPARAPIWSLLAWRERPRELTSYAAVRGTLLSLPPVVALAVLGLTTPGPLVQQVPPSPGPFALSAVGFVATTAIARSVLAGYQLTAYDAVGATSQSTAASTSSTPQRRRRLLLAGILVLGLLVGLSAIRTLDVQPAPADEVEVTPANASATIETAIERTRERDVITEQRTGVWNDSTERWDLAIRRQAILQRSDRSARYYADVGPGSDATDRAMYGADGRLGMLHDPTPPRQPGPLTLTIRHNAWTELVGPPYGWGIEDQFGFPPADASWRLVERTEDRLVYRVATPSTLADHGIDGLPEVRTDGVTPGDRTDARIVVDRRLHTVRQASVTVDGSGNENGTSRPVAIRWEREVSRVGGVTANRPTSLGSPSLPARLWDIVWY